ncbi:unnamed protein product [Ectocarpus sp. 12 AP-2014]
MPPHLKNLTRDQRNTTNQISTNKSNATVDGGGVVAAAVLKSKTRPAREQVAEDKRTAMTSKQAAVEATVVAQPIQAVEIHTPREKITPAETAVVSRTFAFQTKNPLGEKESRTRKSHTDTRAERKSRQISTTKQAADTK